MRISDWSSDVFSSDLKESRGLSGLPAAGITGGMDRPPPQPTFTIDGNRLRLLDTGPDRLDALVALIEGARCSLRIIYYIRSEEHTAELQSPMRISYAVFCLKKHNNN